MELSRSYKRPRSSKLGRHGQQLNGASVKTGMEKGKGLLGKETEHSLEKTS